MTRDEEVTSELLNESILRSASHVEADLISPESTRSTSDLTTWNESALAHGLRIPEASTGACAVDRRTAGRGWHGGGRGGEACCSGD